ncbi:MAG: phosphoadenosine phosphosulfate reductase family protein [Candidatus Magnetobacterium sp. LHC-1]
MLVERTLFGIENKVEKAIARIKEFVPKEGYYVSFSGGKDSQVVLELVKQAGVKYDAHFNLTSVDPKEVIQFVRKFYPEVILHKPKKNMWTLIKENGMPPTRWQRYCCAWLKEGRGNDQDKGRKIITGVRWAESFKRSKRKIVEICMKDKSKTFINPIIEWSDKEIWEFIKINNLSYCCLYDQGFKRIGCIGCPMGSSKQKDMQFKRWPAYKNAYIKSFEKMIIERERKGLEKIRVYSTAEECFNWWISDKKQDLEIPDQSIMFE